MAECFNTELVGFNAEKQSEILMGAFSKVL